MSCSGRLVIQMKRFECPDPTSSSTKSNTFSRGDGVSAVLGHSSRASKMTKIGCCPGSLSMSPRHFAREVLLGCSEPLLQAEYNQ